MHGLVVTYARPESLRRVVAKLGEGGLASVTVVDNAPTSASLAAAQSGASRLPTDYVAMPENVGPAGGLAAGVERILERCSDDDWILVANDDGMPNPSGTVDRLHDFAEWMVGHGAVVGAVGIAGARFDRRTGRLVRPRDAELFGPVTVDYVAGTSS